MASLDERAEALALHDCNLITLSDVTPGKLKWLWPNRFPLGMYSLLTGQPGVGKTQIALSIAAIVSNGAKWPFSDERAEAGDVLILTAEDDPKYTLSPRLIAAEANLDRIHVLQSVAKPLDDQIVDSPLLLSQDMHQLDGVLTANPDIRFGFIDPLSAYLGVKDSHNDANVRQVLGPLKELAEKHEVAILGITHLSKNAANSAMNRSMGSMGIIAAARSAYLVTSHEEELMMLPVKSNVAPKDVGGLTYRIVSKTVREEIETSCVEWTGKTDVDADEALGQQHDNTPKLSEAVEFLKEMLDDGPKYQQDIEVSAKECGIAWATVRRAKDKLQVESHRDTFTGGKWRWYSQEQWASKLEVEKR